MLKLYIQLFGGRGANSKVSGIPRNKRKAINTYNKRIKEHETKIKNAMSGKNGYNKDTIPHWQHEIKVFKNNIEKIERKYKK